MKNKTLLLALGLLGGVVGAKFLYSLPKPRAFAFGVGDTIAKITGDDPIIDVASDLTIEVGNGTITPTGA